MQESKSLNLMQKKQAILDIIRKEGPCLPSAIAGKVSLSLLLASALLSELRAEKKLRVSNLKVGGSPLYYLEGQEAQLESFVKHLPKKEQETFELLKKQEIVDEQKVEPAQRVALKSIKDFAFPVNVKTGSGERIFWRFHSIQPEEASKRISEALKPKKPEAKKEEAKKEEKKEKAEVKEVKLEAKQAKPKTRARGKSKQAKEKFKEKIYAWISSKSLRIEEKLEEPKYGEDALCIISNSSSLGKLSFLVVAKQKKRISEADLSLAYQQGQQAKMPVLLLTEGKLTKKAQAYLEQLGRFIIVSSL